MRRTLALLTLLLTAACGSIPDEVRQPVRQSASTFTPNPDARQCLANLGKTQANFTPLPDKYYGAGCSAINSVRLSRLQSDDATLALSNLGPVACPLANTFAAWARYGVDRAARQILGSPLIRIETMGSYACRNVAGQARLSAHATASAIDISAFMLADGRRISVQADWHSGDTQVKAFLDTVHRSACKRFGTVLGPDYNAAHHDHVHVEIGNSARPFCR